MLAMISPRNPSGLDVNDLAMQKSETVKPKRVVRGLAQMTSDRNLRRHASNRSEWGAGRAAQETQSSMKQILNPTPSQAIKQRRERAFNDGSSMMSHSFFTVAADR